MIKLIHLSDIHFDPSGSQYQHDTLMDALLEDLDKVLDGESLIVITGDLINKGGVGGSNSGESPFDLFNKNILSKIFDKFPLIKNRTLTVPGNHDLERNKIDKIKYAGLLNCVEDDYSSLDKYLGDNVIGDNYFEQLSLYKKFEKDLQQNNDGYGFTYLHSTFRENIDCTDIGIACLNSSWLCCDNDDFGRIAIGANQIERAIQELKDTKIKIALLHHPIGFFREEDRLNIEPLLYGNFDLILTGHTHKIDSSFNQNLYGNVLVSIAQSILTPGLNEEKVHTGYSVIEVYQGVKYSIKFRKYISEMGCFVINTDVGNDEGKVDYILPSTEESATDTKVYSIIESLKKSHLEEINQDLIIYNADDNIPNCIDDIFVAPTICNLLENRCDDDETVTMYEIEDILSVSDNFLVYGPKESGKTIYLDKVIIEAVESFKQYKKVPVHIRFEDIGNHDIIQVIRNFLSINKDEFEEIYNRFTVILAIDNICFPSALNGNKRDFHNLKKLVKFVEKYPNVQVIATSNQLAESLLPTDHFEYNQYFDFNVTFLHSLKTSQIKYLISKWFSNRDVDFQDNLEKLFTTFRDLGLPKTPLSVTMFLWIINKQEKEPVNNAVLVEIFIENLLEKANFSNAYSSSFDFYNKKRLLTRFAKHVYDHGDKYSSYSLDYEEALSFFRIYLENKYGNPKSILDSFIERRILMLADDDQVRFKSAFFFHYFLASYIDSDHKFKKFVFNNMLDFSSEIEYYTGLKRDSEEILDIIIDSLHDSFDELNETILSQFKEIDNFFETSEPLSKHIDMDKARKKPTEKELEQAYDDRLDHIAVKNDIKPKELDQKTSIKLDSLLKISSIVLKNSEEIDDFDKRCRAYNLIIRSSISFLVLYRQFMMDYFKHNESKPHYFPKNLDFNFFLKILPLIHQVVIYDWIGTVKLSPVLIKKIESDVPNDEISHYERFLSVFIYADSNGHGYRQYIEKFCKGIKHNYLLDSVFFKVLSYYYLRPGNKETDKYYLEFLANLRVKQGRVGLKHKVLEKIKLKHHHPKRIN